MYHTAFAMGGSGDYGVVTSTKMDFTAGSSNGATRCLQVAITDDRLVECDEQFNVSLTLVTVGDQISTGNVITTITIMDNDGM